MIDQELYQLKFPVGEFKTQENITRDQVEIWINEIEAFPNTVKGLVEGLSVEEKNWKYRPGGWNIKQVVHHCSDSHINSLVRFKLALTEENPTIRPYEEALWAELVDSIDDDLTTTLQLTDALHKKWVKVLRSISSEQMTRGYVHPDHGRKVPLDEAIGMYAWHCRTHLAHINQALEAKGKYN